ncbi:MAG: metallophosphoesterase [Agriterribacter sp.]
MLFICGEAQVLLRGPYLQMATSTSINIRWRTDIASISRVRYGTSAGSLTNTAEDLSSKTEHDIKLTGLSPNTFYWYSIEGASGILQGDAENYFKTFPAVGQKQLYRIGVFGDCGSNNTNQLDVRNSIAAYLGSNYMNAWILLGDNAYGNGTDAQYNNAFFAYYKEKFLKQNPLYPAPGNHDYDSPTGARTAHNNPYYSIFTIPTAGEAGGVPSGTKAYYSFDIGNIHFISLDSDGLHGPEGNQKKIYDLPNVQADWLIQDLEANTNKGWVIAYWHHPPFTKGSHDSDNFTNLDADLVEVRTKLIKILEDHGVDLILCGHSHVYERTKLLKGYYGLSSDFSESVYALNMSSGKYDATTNSCPYYKNASTGNAGTLYVVAGSAGQRGGAGQIPNFPHKAMYYSNKDVAGALMLEIEANRLDAKWIDQHGVIQDRFTMMKDVNRNTTYNTSVGSPVTLQASYIGSYQWSNTQTTSFITVTPAAEGSEAYIVKDDKECVADTFNIIASRVLPLTWKSIKAWYSKEELSNRLQWETMNELNVMAFDIERSENAIDFKQIATVKAVGNTDTHFYDFSDKSISSSVKKYYYKIRQEDKDGKFSYSSVVSVDRSGDMRFDIKIIPNPGKPGQIRILLSSDKPGKTAFTIVNADGKIVLNKKIQLTQSPQTFLPGMQSGVYFVRLQNEGQVVTKKFVVE